MNNVYKELGAQATEYCQARGENTAWLWEEKFAELVVRECLKHTSYILGSGDSDDVALEEASTAIKRTFGIK